MRAAEPRELVTLAEFPHRALAEPIVSLLRGNGIPAILKLDDCGGLDPTGAFMYGACVMVPCQHEPRAHEILAALRLATTEPEPSETT